MKVVIAGGSGLIGQALARRLLGDGHEVVVLTRGAKVEAGRAVAWDAMQVGEWSAELADAGALVNLCGASIGEGRWSGARKREIRDSRVKPAETLARAWSKVHSGAPGSVIQASGVGYYGTHETHWFDESSPPGDDYLAQLACEWEAAGADLWPDDVRRIVVRMGVVWSMRGGALGRLLLPFRLFVGGRLGSGRQPLSWIHADDLVEALVYLLFSADVDGPVNCCAPEAPSNAELARAIGAALGRPSWLPMPAFALRLLLGEMASLVLEGQRVRPQVLLDAGFEFRYPDVESALADLLGAS